MSKVASTTASLVIPALNEEDVIGLTLRAIPSSLYRSVVVADNGSTDRTAEIARQEGALVVTELERVLWQESSALEVGGLSIIDRCRCGDDFCARFLTGPSDNRFW